MLKIVGVIEAGTGPRPTASRLRLLCPAHHHMHRRLGRGTDAMAPQRLMLLLLLLLHAKEYLAAAGSGGIMMMMIAIYVRVL